MKIIFSGGGTLGPVTPLLAIQEIIKRERPEVEYVWVGTKLGPERQLVESLGIRFVTIASGKFRRYLSPVEPD
jgi:UDP-N-acetylglucosamine--N-acetylmuramyl-(pentapeptide) pyrophosphoryl-undecaprenol N-acetylglucosamine transferase